MGEDLKALDPDGHFRNFVQDVIDGEIADLRARFVSGEEPLTTETVLRVIDQLIQDRARLRGLIERNGSTIQ